MLDSITNMMLMMSAKRRGPGDPLVEPPAPKKPLWMMWIGGVWIANYAAFVLGAAYLGGDALNGYVKDGHYFVAMRHHASEVSRAVFLYSKWHAISVWASLVVAVLFSFLAKRRSIA